MVLAAVNDDLYRLLYLGHIITILAAFAPAVIHPVLGAQGRADGVEASSRLAGYMAANTRRIHFPALVVTAAFGIALIIASDEAWAFDQLWVSLSFLVWIALCGVVSGMILPAERRLAAGDADAERKVSLGGQAATALLLVMLYLMIWKPGL